MAVAPGALLSFSLGPVPALLASARSVAELRSGGLLLTRLASAAMRPVREAHGPEAFLLPGDPPLEPPSSPTLPTRFLALVPDGAAVDLARRCEEHCRRAGGDHLEIRTAVLPRADATPERCAGLFAEMPTGWRLECEVLAGLVAATQAVRGPYLPSPPGFAAGEGSGVRGAEAVLLLDADRLGKLLAGAGSPDGARAIGLALATFTREVVPAIVARHGGDLILSGDDVLAVLPTASALACAGEFEAAYRAAGAGLDPGATLSGGLAVVRDELPRALADARAALRRAKVNGRDALALAGDGPGVVIGWEAVRQAAHLRGDRWRTALRTALPVLAIDDPAAIDRFRVEARRLLGDGATGLLDGHVAWADGRGWSAVEALEDFVALVESAAALARGRP